MSNSLAIAAVTATLRSRLFIALGGAEVTTAPPDLAATAVNSDHVNLFLYRADLHPTFRNEPLAGPPGETPRPVLPLVLHYLLASYSNDETRAQQLLCSAMLALHDGPSLLGDQIQQATQAAGGPLTGSDLHLQTERVKITHESLSQDDIAKMWTAFQAPYRMSSSYQVSVVLVESELAGATPLPVLRRGADDRSPATLPQAAPPYPALIEVIHPIAGLASALPGETVTLRARNLPAGALEARLRHSRLRLPVTVSLPDQPAPGDEPVAVPMPLPAAGLPAGRWSVTLADPGADESLTEERALAVRPEVVTLAATAVPGSGGRVRVQVTAAQPIRVGQQAVVLVGGEGLAVRMITADAAIVAVTAAVPPGTAKIRLRVDGVDSDIVDRATGQFRTGPAVEVVIP